MQDEMPLQDTGEERGHRTAASGFREDCIGCGGVADRPAFYGPIKVHGSIATRKQKRDRSIEPLAIGFIGNEK